MQKKGPRAGSEYRRSIVLLLRLQDAQPIFPFERLIPELRNIIYRELVTLHIKSDRMVCFPEILRASKAVYQEASDILYGDKTLSARVVFGYGDLALHFAGNGS